MCFDDDPGGNADAAIRGVAAAERRAGPHLRFSSNQRKSKGQQLKGKIVSELSEKTYWEHSEKKASREPLRARNSN